MLYVSSADGRCFAPTLPSVPWAVAALEELSCHL